MSLRDDNLHLALMKAIADTVGAFMTDLRAERLDDLLDVYEDTGNKSFSVKLPNGQKVATITLPEQKEFFDVANEAKFLDWVRANKGADWVETIVVPPQPQLTYEKPAAHQVAPFLKGLQPGPDGTAFDPATGEIVEGVAYRPAGRPKSFTVTYDGGQKGRARLIDAWRTGELKELFGADVFPQIGS